MEEGKIMEFDEVHWDMYKAMKRRRALSYDPRKMLALKRERAGNRRRNLPLGNRS
jgi:hypothetical protein